MTDNLVHPEPKLNWRFPRVFWIANTAELFERAAFYGMFIALVLYLTREIGFSDKHAGYLAACFSSVLYLLSTFLGAWADKFGFRRSLMVAFVLLTAGYALLGAAPNAPSAFAGLMSVKGTAIAALSLIVCGGAMVKPVISGTVAKCSDERHRARAFSIFYQIVNIGAFTGKSIAAPIREHWGLQYINYYAAVMAFCAFVFVLLFYRDPDVKGKAKTAREVALGLITVVKNFRFMALILIVAGFWLIQGQLYATMPKYMLRLLGEGAKPEWLANINPFVVVLLVLPITHMVRNFQAVNAVGIALFIIPISALFVAFSPMLATVTGSSVSIFGLFTLHPITLMVVIGIALQGFAECFLSPKFLEFASKQAPEGEVGLYMGYSHLHTCIAWAVGFALSGHLLERYCPNPTTLTPEVHAQWQAAIETGSAMPDAYAHAHYIWFVYAAVGIAAFIALLVFKFITASIDRKRA